MHGLPMVYVSPPQNDAVEPYDSSAAYDSEVPYKRIRRSRPWRRNVRPRLSWTDDIDVSVEELQIHVFPGTQHSNMLNATMIREAAVAIRDATAEPRNITAIERQAASLIASRDLGSVCVGDRYLIYNKNLVDVKPVLSIGAINVADNQRPALPRAWLQNVEVCSLTTSWYKDGSIRCPNPDCRSFNHKGATMCWSCLAHWLRLDTPSSLS